MKFLFILLFLFSRLLAEQIDLVANWGVDASPLTESVKDTGLTIHLSDLSEYGENLLKKKPTILQKWGLIKPKLPVIPASAAKIVFWNLTDTQIRKLDLSKLPIEKLVLFMWEPPTVLEKMYQKSSLDLFDRVYTVDDDLVDGKRIFKFYYPELKPMRTELPSFEEKKFCTLIAGCKKSEWKGELYSERVRAIDFFETKSEGEFEFFGRGWDPAQYTSYRGSIGNKLDVLKNYRFSICFENTCDMNGYITEKIFDCFAAGCVPIYWGAPNVTHYIPKDCFIDFRDFDSYEALYAFLKAMSKDTYETYLQNIRHFLESDKAQLFSRAHFLTIFREAVTASKKSASSLSSY